MVRPLHVQRAHVQMFLWKAADKSDPTSVNITDADYGLEVYWLDSLSTKTQVYTLK